jgi:hypothetical protein
MPPPADRPPRPVDDAIFDSVKEGRRRNQALLSSTMELSARELVEAMVSPPVTLQNFRGNRSCCWPVRQTQEYLLDLLFNQANMSLLVRKRVVEDEDGMARDVYDIGDGVNRSTAVVRFLQNEVAIPMPDPEEEGAVQHLLFCEFPTPLQQEWVKKARFSIRVLTNVSDSHFASLIRKTNIGNTGLKPQVPCLRRNRPPPAGVLQARR